MCVEGGEDEVNEMDAETVVVTVVGGIVLEATVPLLESTPTGTTCIDDDDDDDGLSNWRDDRGDDKLPFDDNDDVNGLEGNNGTTGSGTSVDDDDGDDVEDDNERNDVIDTLLLS
jgi:hypothetical protein